jgi:cytochrome c-type biogenesis protein CcmH
MTQNGSPQRRRDRREQWFSASLWFKAVFATLAVLLALQGAAWAVQPGEMLKDPVLEGRARELSKNLRCLVCQNESIDDSDADLAKDLRVLLRQRLQAGDTDQQAVQYLVDRYGEYVLLKPRFETKTLVLWLGPGVLLLLALGAAYSFFRRRAETSTAEGSATPLSEAERRRLNSLLADQDKS